MRKKIRNVTVWATAIFAVAAFLACQSDVTEPTPAQMEITVTDDDHGMIYGYVKTDADPPVPISGATVTWTSVGDPPVELGTDTTSFYGYYEIKGKYWWEYHTGEILEGKAEHPNYETGYNYIFGYFYPWSYMRNFFLSGSE